MQLDNYKHFFSKGSSNNRLLLLSAFILFWTAFSTFATTHHKAEAGHHFQKRSVYFTNPQKVMQLPGESSSAIWEMEIAADDDRKKPTDCFRNHIAVNDLTLENNFGTCLKSRFLQIASSVNNRPRLSLLVLHHSWKYDLS